MIYKVLGLSWWKRDAERETLENWRIPDFENRWTSSYSHGPANGGKGWYTVAKDYYVLVSYQKIALPTFDHPHVIFWWIFQYSTLPESGAKKIRYWRSIQYIVPLYLPTGRKNVITKESLIPRHPVWALKLIIGPCNNLDDLLLGQPVRTVTDYQWWAKLLRLLTVNSLSYFVKIKY